MMYLMANALLHCATPAPPAWLWVCVSKTPLNREQSMLPAFLRVHPRDRVRAIAELGRDASGSNGAVLHVSIVAPQAAGDSHEAKHYALLLTLVHARPAGMPMFCMHPLLLDSLGGDVWDPGHLQRRQQQLARVLAGEVAEQQQQCECKAIETAGHSVRRQGVGSHDCAYAVTYMLRWLLCESVGADASAGSVFAAARKALRCGAADYSAERVWWQEEAERARSKVKEWDGAVAAAAGCKEASEDSAPQCKRRSRSKGGPAPNGSLICGSNERFGISLE